MGLNHPEHTEKEYKTEMTLARLGDAKGLTHVQKQTWIDTYPNESIGLTVEDVQKETETFDTPERLESWEETIRSLGDNKQVWVARENGIIVGYCVAEKTPEVHEIRSLYLLPTHHGRGIGKALLDAAIAWLGNERNINVFAFSHNKKGIAFYEKCGFHESGKTGSMQINGKTIPDKEFVKKMH